MLQCKRLSSVWFVNTHTPTNTHTLTCTRASTGTMCEHNLVNWSEDCHCCLYVLVVLVMCRARIQLKPQLDRIFSFLHATSFIDSLHIVVIDSPVHPPYSTNDIDSHFCTRLFNLIDSIRLRFLSSFFLVGGLLFAAGSKIPYVREQCDAYHGERCNCDGGNTWMLCPAEASVYG